MKLLIACLGALTLCSCSTTHLVYVHEANIGLSLTPPSAEGGKTKLSLGYDNETFVHVPKAKDGSNKDAMSLVAASQIKSVGVEKLYFGHVIATGSTAVAVAKNPDVVKKVQDKLRDERDKAVNGEGQ